MNSQTNTSTKAAKPQVYSAAALAEQYPETFGLFSLIGAQNLSVHERPDGGLPIGDGILLDQGRVALKITAIDLEGPYLRVRVQLCFLE